jgi:NADPH-dependent ferric siderophore reductase
MATGKPVPSANGTKRMYMRAAASRKVHESKGQVAIAMVQHSGFAAAGKN